MYDFNRERMIEAVNEVMHPTVQLQVVISYIYQIQRQREQSTIGDYYPAKKRCIDDELVLLIADMFLPFSLASNPFFKLMMNEAGIGDICILRQLFEGSNWKRQEGDGFRQESAIGSRSLFNCGWNDKIWYPLLQFPPLLSFGYSDYRNWGPIHCCLLLDIKNPSWGNCREDWKYDWRSYLWATARRHQRDFLCDR